MKIFVIGASAGGNDALKIICNNLPADFPGAIFIVWHLSPGSLGILPKMLSKGSELPINNAEDNEEIKPRNIYIASPDKHLLLEKNKIRVVYGPKENRFRPAIDPLFRSAAFSHGENTVGIILTGMLNDGTAGLWSIKDCGGITIVQDPDDAMFSDMPLNAIKHVDIDYKLPIKEIAPIITKLAFMESAVPKEKEKTEQLGIEVKMALDKKINETDIKKLGNVSEFTCPECNGSLWKMNYGNIIRFRCRTGHAFTIEALMDELSDSIEDQLWKSMRGLEENSALIKHLVNHLNKDEKNKDVDYYLQLAAKAEKNANNLRKILMEQIVPDSKLKVLG